MWEDKRRSKRLKIDMKLVISDLFKQDNVKLDVNAPIYVDNISKHGIGFSTASKLEIGYYFNAKIKLGNDNSRLYTVVRIVRALEMENGLMYYGCEFIGLAPVLDFIFDDYEKSLENKQVIN